MKKSLLFTGVILAAIILIELISTITNKTNPSYVYAFDPLIIPPHVKQLILQDRILSMILTQIISAPA